MIKKSAVLIGALLIIFSVLVLAQQNRMKINFPESISDNNLPISVSLFDEKNNAIKSNVMVTLKDAEGSGIIKNTILANQPTEINLGENPRAGLWSITAEYQNIKVTGSFAIETNEKVEFRVQDDKLIIKNVGNTRYSKDIDIKIGNTVGTKKVNLGIGEETSFKLLAPEENYNIIVTDGKTTLTKNNVALTGNFVGILDEKVDNQNSYVTGSLQQVSESGGTSFYSSVKDKRFAYIFLFVVIGAAVLLEVERRYRNKV